MTFECNGLLLIHLRATRGWPDGFAFSPRLPQYLGLVHIGLVYAGPSCVCRYSTSFVSISCDQSLIQACSYSHGSSSKRAGETCRTPWGLSQNWGNISALGFWPKQVPWLCPDSGGRGQQRYMAEDMDAEKGNELRLVAVQTVQFIPHTYIQICCKNKR